MRVGPPGCGAMDVLGAEEHRLLGALTPRSGGGCPTCCAGSCWSPRDPPAERRAGKTPRGDGGPGARLAGVRTQALRAWSRAAGRTTWRCADTFRLDMDARLDLGPVATVPRPRTSAGAAGRSGTETR